MPKDITGLRFERLVAIRFVSKKKINKNLRYFWLFRCDCGNEKIIRHDCVISGHTKSCGCLSKEISSLRSGINHPMYGKKLSKEIRKKIGESRLYPRGKEHPRYGKKHSEETKLKMIKNHYNVTGKNNPNWLGGKTFEEYGKKFNKKLKNEILERDNYTCQECGRKNVSKNLKLAIHHIDYNKKNNKHDNLISLCNSCHSKTNFKRKDWKKYLRRKNNIYG